MLVVECRQDIARVVAQIFADHRLLGGEGTTLRRARIGDGDNLSDHPLVPAGSGFDKEVIFVGTIAADLAVWDIQTAGTDAGGLGKYLDQIDFAKSVTCRMPRALPAVGGAARSRGHRQGRYLASVSLALEPSRRASP